MARDLWRAAKQTVDVPGCRSQKGKGYRAEKGGNLGAIVHNSWTTFRETESISCDNVRASVSFKHFFLNQFDKIDVFLGTNGLRCVGGKARAAQVYRGDKFLETIHGKDLFYYSNIEK